MSNNKVSKIYPQRLTKNIIKIKLYCKHDCNNNICDLLLAPDLNNPNILLISKNPRYKDGKCDMINKNQQSFIRLSTFNINNPICEEGRLYNSDEKVISDNSFTLIVSYPLSFNFEVLINNDLSVPGFTLKELIHSIQVLYKFIYEEEERTATQQIYRFSKNCSECTNKNISEFIKNTKIDKKDDNTCSICYSDYEENDNTSRLHCGHVFHDECILEWIKKSSEYTCPLCRSCVFVCENCDNTGHIYYYFRGATIPVENRNILSHRNETDGVFGIHSVDYENLILEYMIYDNINKKLYININ